MNTRKKIVKLDTLKRKISNLRKKGKKIAFTNGCFDILHLGHISYLESIKKPDRIVILALNSDVSIKKIKGPSRPIAPQNSRSAVIAALECIDYVVLFNDETPFKLIKSLKPDILVKGADWKGKGAVGADLVNEYGGKVEYIKYVSNFSTSNIIDKIKNKCKK
ncbi:MAG: D-glycero-beta-D-manno-heptose 1-phosphate adenylyltransferase [Candidatus Zapsychrus exili]|nr:D-glycero-beta-D-manno-heptose 1-phosphate adenylyltransferase [Candidatus Zapsychrus exili]